MLILSEVVRGSSCSIYALSSENAEPCHEFLESTLLQHRNEHAKLLARLQRTADHGPPRNQEQCRQLNGDRPEETVYEFKTKKLRLFWFYDENRLILCANGIVKGTAKEQKQAIATARNWKAQYQVAKLEQQIKINP